MDLIASFINAFLLCAVTITVDLSTKTIIRVVFYFFIMTNYASLKEVLISYFNRYPYTLLPLYTKAYKNPLIVALKSALRHYPFTAYLKNGDKVTITGKGYKIAS